jgi:hypothetical protein
MSLDPLKSKKLIAMIVGLILLIVRSVWPELAEMETTEIVQLIGAYIIGQGVADHGKEKAKIEAQK